MTKEEEWGMLLKLRFAPPATFAKHEVDDKHMPLDNRYRSLIKKRYACIRPVNTPLWFDYEMYISLKGIKVVQEVNVVWAVEYFLTSYYHFTVQLYISKLPMEALPELIHFQMPGANVDCVRRAAMKRMDQLKGERNKC